MLDGKRRQICVHNQRPFRLALGGEFLQNGPMALRGIEKRGGGALEP